MGTAIADGEAPDLVVALDYSKSGGGGSGTGYVGAVSFESVPEPSTWGMMAGGVALLGFCVRRKLA